MCLPLTDPFLAAAKALPKRDLCGSGWRGGRHGPHLPGPVSHGRLRGLRRGGIRNGHFR